MTPKIVSQAIRGLLVFKGQHKVDETLKPLLQHENETVRTIIQQAYLNTQKIAEDKLKHKECYDYLKNTVVLGDVRKTLQAIPNESFHLTFTSPPYYNARDYAIYPSYQAYLSVF